MRRREIRRLAERLYAAALASEVETKLYATGPREEDSTRDFEIRDSELNWSLIRDEGFQRETAEWAIVAALSFSSEWGENFPKQVKVPPAVLSGINMPTGANVANKQIAADVTDCEVALEKHRQEIAGKLKNDEAKKLFLWRTARRP